MAGVTRRNALGLAGGAAGLAGCGLFGGRQTFEREGPLYAGRVGFDHGVASGDPMSDRVIIWTRATPKSGSGPIPMVWAVFADQAMTTLVAEGFVEATAERDYTVKVDVAGLEPSTEYFYQFAARTTAADILSPTGRTKTLAAGGEAPVTLAVVSCSNYPFGYFNVYREIANQDGLDAIVHLGDYLYEYGVDGYGGATGAQLGRDHVPAVEIVTLDDYRTRHAQYKTDPDLQAAHAAAPWLCTWDDHESTNNSYRTGAQNHNPEENEGDWTTRKQRAVQAYLEWMPVRDPQPGRLQESIYRKFDFGDVATIFCLETRLTGRSDEISWFTELGDKSPAEIPAAAAATLERVNDPARTMLGAAQETWLAEGLRASTGAGKTWQVLANQTIMAKVKPPRFGQTLTPEQLAAQTSPYVRQLVPFSDLGVAWNLDAWDGFPAARGRLYAAVQDAGARLVTLTGDTHTAWANTLFNEEGYRAGVEFACTSVTSPGLGQTIVEVPDLGQQFVDANQEVDWFDPFGSGFTLVTLTKDAARATYYKVSGVETRDYTVEKAAEFETAAEPGGASALRAV